MRTWERAAGFRVGRPVSRGLTSYRRSSGAVGVAAIPAAELLHPPGRVQDARLPGVERVARRGDLDDDDGIGLAVLPGDGALAGRGRPGEEGEEPGDDGRRDGRGTRCYGRLSFLGAGLRGSVSACAAAARVGWIVSLSVRR